MPPVPVVVEKIVVNGPVAAGAVWIWNDRANAASQVSRTWQTVAVAPRSTWIHCGSENADDQRVVALPSTAAEAGVPAFSVDDHPFFLILNNAVGGDFPGNPDAPTVLPQRM